MALHESEFEFVDVNGGRASEQYFMDTGDLNPVGNPLIALIQACSLAALVKSTNRLFDATPVGSTSEGPYDDAEDKLTIECIEAGSGARTKTEYPAPFSAAFLADTETMDSTYCADLITAIQTHMKGPNGGALTVVRGYRSRVPRYKAT
jgi:hypothetical protein